MTPETDFARPTTTVCSVDPSADPRWDAYAAAHPDGLVFHLAGWLRSLHREYPRAAQQCLAAVDASGSFKGILPLQWTAGLPVGPRSIVGRRLASLPRTPVAGPLADDPATARALLEGAVSATSRVPGATLQVKLVSAAGVADVPGTVVHPWRESFVIDLPESEDEVRFGNSRNHSRIRWAVNKARKEGVTVTPAASVDDVRAWYPLYLEALRFNAVPPRPRRLFEALWEELAPQQAMHLLIARDGSGAPIGGAVVLEFGSTAFYAFNGVRRAALGLRPNDVVQWEAIHGAVRRGRRHYDLGEVEASNEGLAQFKSKWGAQARRLQRLYHPAPEAAPDPGLSGGHGPVRARLERVYRHFPLPATAVIGDRLYRYL